MPRSRKDPDMRIAELEQRKAQLQAQLDQEKAKKRTAQRKLETRQKVIIGGMIKAHCERDPQFKAWIDDLLDRFVTRDHDRKALGLPPLENQTSE